MSTATKADSKLNDQQDLFCHEYLTDLNGTQAAIRAKYSEKTAAQTSSRLLTYVNIQARIQELVKKRERRDEKTTDDVIKELECVGFSRLGKVMSWNQSGMAFTKDSDELDDDAMASIESVKVTEIVSKTEDGNDMLRTEIKLHPKLPALKELAKHHGICNDTVEHTGAVGLVVNVIDYSKVKIEGDK